MKVNFTGTEWICSALSDLIHTSRITVSTENTDYKGQTYRSDYVTLEKDHKIGFENFGNEIIVYFFNEHTHFSRPDSIEDVTEYITDSIVFLRELFTTPLVMIETFRGNKRVRYEWFFLRPDGRKDSIAGVCIEKLLVNPFRKQRLEMTFWRYQQDFGTFVQITDEKESLHKYDWDILIHIRRLDNAYTFHLERYFFDEEGTQDYFWTPLHIPGISLYDTQEKALQAAKAAAKQYCLEYKERTIFDT